jgi:lysophospholipase L1-like esterase
VIAFGDSLTAGYRIDAAQAWPARLSAIVGRPILNRGVSGETAGEARTRLERDVLAADPRVVLVCLGVNDIAQRVPPGSRMHALREIVEGVQARGALVVLIGVEGYAPPGEASDYGTAYRELARKTGAVYVPDLVQDVLGDPERMLDRIHPNPTGHEAIARRLAREAGRYLSR